MFVRFPVEIVIVFDSIYRVGVVAEAEKSSARPTSQNVTKSQNIIFLWS